MSRIMTSFQPCNDLTFQTLPFCSYQAWIGNHRSTETSDVLLTKFCQQSDFLALMRLSNTFKSQDHIQAAIQAVSCMNHCIQLVLNAGESRTDMVQSFKTTLLVRDSIASFGLIPFCADVIHYVECDIDVKHIFKLNKVVDFGIT